MGFFDGIGEWLGDTAKDVWGAAKGAVKTVVGGVMDIGNAVIVQPVKHLAGGVVDFAKDTWTNGLGSAFSHLGQNFVEDGKEQLAAFGNIFKNFGENAWDAVKNAGMAVADWNTFGNASELVNTLTWNVNEESVGETVDAKVQELFANTFERTGGAYTYEQYLADKETMQGIFTGEGSLLGEEGKLASMKEFMDANPYFQAYQEIEQQMSDLGDEIKEAAHEAYIENGMDGIEVAINDELNDHAVELFQVGAISSPTDPALAFAEPTDELEIASEEIDTEAEEAGNGQAQEVDEVGDYEDETSKDDGTVTWDDVKDDMKDAVSKDEEQSESNSYELTTEDIAMLGAYSVYTHISPELNDYMKENFDIDITSGITSDRGQFAEALGITQNELQSAIDEVYKTSSNYTADATSFVNDLVAKDLELGDVTESNDTLDFHGKVQLSDEALENLAKSPITLAMESLYGYDGQVGNGQHDDADKEAISKAFEYLAAAGGVNAVMDVVDGLRAEGPAGVTDGIADYVKDLGLDADASKFVETVAKAYNLQANVLESNGRDIETMRESTAADYDQISDAAAVFDGVEVEV